MKKKITDVQELAVEVLKVNNLPEEFARQIVTDLVDEWLDDFWYESESNDYRAKMVISSIRDLKIVDEEVHLTWDWDNKTYAL